MWYFVEESLEKKIFGVIKLHLSHHHRLKQKASQIFENINFIAATWNLWRM